MISRMGNQILCKILGYTWAQHLKRSFKEVKWRSQMQQKQQLIWVQNNNWALLMSLLSKMQAINWISQINITHQYHKIWEFRASTHLQQAAASTTLLQAHLARTRSCSPLKWVEEGRLWPSLIIWASKAWWCHSSNNWYSKTIWCTLCNRLLEEIIIAWVSTMEDKWEQEITHLLICTLILGLCSWLERISTSKTSMSKWSSKSNASSNSSERLKENQVTNSKSIQSS